MKSIYPVSPTTVPVDLSKPKKSYQQRAILAMAGLSLFVTLYFALTAWFIWTAYRLFTTPNVGARGIFLLAVLRKFPGGVYG